MRAHNLCLKYSKRSLANVPAVRESLLLHEQAKWHDSSSFSESRLLKNLLGALGAHLLVVWSDIGENASTEYILWHLPSIRPVVFARKAWQHFCPELHEFVSSVGQQSTAAARNDGLLKPVQCLQNCQICMWSGRDKDQGLIDILASPTDPSYCTMTHPSHTSHTRMQNLMITLPGSWISCIYYSVVCVFSWIVLNCV